MFYPSTLVVIAAANAEKHAWAAEARQRIVEATQPWMKLSDDALWDLMFGNTIRRSWMVWSNGHCPSCRADVPMYEWRVDALGLPWKMTCPHCSERFPKNDFHRFYLSGLDEHGVFDPARADRSLLFNEEHPDSNDPLYSFGVDDGEGYVEGERRWRFIGAYLIYGQWKQGIVAGIRNLAAAYIVTGEASYAHKAAVLLDRVADLYPTHDFGKQGVMYEGPPSAGYVSTWHDACEETREMALAYDQVAGALANDPSLVTFLSRKAARFELENPKSSSELIRKNIEDGILRHAIEHRDRIMSNYPRTETAIATMKSILDWPANRAEVMELIGAMLEQATAVDGVTGEKGLSGYSAYTIAGLAQFIALYTRIEPGFLAELLAKHPALRQTYRFFIDTWCGQSYYPTCGDSGGFATKNPRYCGVFFQRPASLAPSMYSFLWQLYKLTGDPAYVQVLYHENDGKLDGLPHDLFTQDPERFQREVAAVIDREGTAIRLGSLDKQQWHLAILRSGERSNWRALWLDYDSGGRHAHCDGMNLGFYAKGLDLMPDLGYPPVQYGGWGSPRSVWYSMTAAHNTVTIDGQNQQGPYSIIVAGKTMVWAEGELFRAIRVSAPELIAQAPEGTPRQFERTTALIDISDRDCYVLDIFRVVGGKDHAKFVHSHYSELTTQGLKLEPATDYGYNTQMRHFRRDLTPTPGWSADWKIEDRHGYLPPGSDVRLRFTDLSRDVQAYTCEGWVSMGFYSENREAWIPRLLVRRSTEAAPLASTFIAVIEPYERQSNIAAIRRLSLQTPDGGAYGDADVAVEVTLTSGARDLLIAADTENPLGLAPAFAEVGALFQEDWDVLLTGELCWLRKRADGSIERLILCNARSAKIGGVSLDAGEQVAFAEFTVAGGRVRRIDQ